MSEFFAVLVFGLLVFIALTLCSLEWDEWKARQKELKEEDYEDDYEPYQDEEISS